LDANSARETPARQQTKTTDGAAPSGVLPSAESILRRVIAQLKGDSPAQNAAQTAPQQPADILGRMLARAANADAQRNGSTPVSGATAHATQPPGSDSSSQIFARLIHVIAQAANDNASNDGGKQSKQFAFDKNAMPQIHHTQSSVSNTTVPAFSAALTNATASAVQSGPAAAPPAIDPQAVIEQVVKGIVTRNFGSTSEVRMRLQPENLGDVSLKLTVTGNTISANIVAQNADVRNMLMGNQHLLARTLAEAGLSLGNFSVDVSGGNPGFSQQQTAQHRSLSKAGALHMSALGDADESWADSGFGPPVLTGAKPLVLNYLA
jgi:flagellar hook-length control protein FliK